MAELPYQVGTQPTGRPAGNTPAPVQLFDPSQASQFRNAPVKGQNAPTLDAFEQQLGRIAPQFLDANFGASDVGAIGDIFQGIGTGKSDPRFENFRQAQLNQLGTDQTRQEAMTSDFFSRRGLGGSAAQLNQLQGVGTEFADRRQSLTGQIGLQQLGRQDQALQTAAGLFGQRAGLQQQAFDQQSAGLEALTLPFTLETARRATDPAPAEATIPFTDFGNQSNLESPNNSPQQQEFDPSTIGP